MKDDFVLPDEVLWLKQIQGSPQYAELINQLCKDFSRSGHSFEFNSHLEALQLFHELRIKLFGLIASGFSDFLNLMYLCDVPENLMDRSRAQDRVDFATYATVILLNREWEKINWRNQNIH